MSKARTGRRFPPARTSLTAAAAMLLALGAGVARADPCDAGPRADAERNAASYGALAFAPFGRPESGWAIYEALIAREIGTRCPAATPGFALALARWRAAHRLGRDGLVDPATLAALRHLWEVRRPFVAISRIACPAPPPAAALAQARPDESYGGKLIQLRAGAMDAYRRLRAAARTAAPIAADRRLMTIFSAYRDPEADAGRCVREGNCQGVVRAACSAHRTGLAMDLYLGAAPGHALDSADDVNRLYLSRTFAYRWLVSNAGRFGFVNYPFEPWHWEWTGEAP